MFQVFAQRTYQANYSMHLHDTDARVSVRYGPKIATGTNRKQ